MRRPATAIAVALALLLLTAFAASAAAKPKLKTPASPKLGLITPSTVQLRWKDRSKESSFEVKVKPGGSSTQARRDAEDATVAGLLPNKKYKLQVRACKGGKCSAYTKAKQAKTHKVPAGAPPFGFNEGLIADDPGNALLAGSGASFVRVPISWAQTQPTLLGGFNWAYMDQVASELAGLGVKPLWVLTGSPCWARLDVGCAGGTTDKAPNPLFYDAYASFAAEVAKRYPTARGVQVWNEPNIPKFWAPTPSTSEYRSLLRKTAAAVRDSGSSVPVVFGAPSPIDLVDAAGNNGKIPATTFLRETLKGGVPGLDAVAIHPYAFNEAGDQITNGIAIYDSAAAVVKSVSPSLPIWVTEIGFTTAGSFGVTAAEQAAALSATYEALVERGVKLISVHRLFDQSDPDLAFEAGMGVIAPDRETVKPAYCSLAILRGLRPDVCR